MSVGLRRLHRVGAKEWVLEKEGKHVKQILSESLSYVFLSAFTTHIYSLWSA